MQNAHRIPLRDDQDAWVDNLDATLIAGFQWSLTGGGYVQAWRGNWHVYLHRLIAGAGSGEQVDHINGDKLDNRTANLRIATHSENGSNRGPDRRRLGTSSDYKGVHWDKKRERWVVNIHANGHTRYLGRFTDENNAARAYNAAAVEQWGEFARLNIVPD